MGWYWSIENSTIEPVIFCSALANIEMTLRRTEPYRYLFSELSKSYFIVVDHFNHKARIYQRHPINEKKKLDMSLKFPSY